MRQRRALLTRWEAFYLATWRPGNHVNAVAPGVVETDMSNFTKTDAGRDLALGMQALKRLASPTISVGRRLPGVEDARWITGDPSMWTAAQSSERWRRSTTATLVNGNLLVAQRTRRSA